MSKLYKLTRSSENPEELSLTIRGILVGLVPLLMVVTGLTEADLKPFIDVIAEIVFLVASVVASFRILYGLIRKVQNRRWTAAS